VPELREPVKRAEKTVSPAEKKREQKGKGLELQPG